jgi:hypothetical protein
MQTRQTLQRFFTGAFFCCLLALPLDGFAADKRPVLGFTMLESSGIDKYDAEVISQLLRNEIGRWGIYRTLELSDISLRLAEQNISDRCSNVLCAIAAGQILGADYFGLGSIDKIGKTFAISMQIVEVSSGRIVRNVSEFYPGKYNNFIKKVIPVFAQEISGFSVKKKGFGIK